MPRDFWLQVFFSWTSFPQAPEYPITAVLSFVLNSRRYLQLKVHHPCRWHRWQMKKSSNWKVLIIFYLPLSIVELKGGFFWIFSFYVHYSALLHLLPLRFHCVWGCWDRTQDCCDFVIDDLTTWLDLIHNLARSSQVCSSLKLSQLFATVVVDTSSKFATGINDTSCKGGKICHRCS